MKTIGQILETSAEFRISAEELPGMDMRWPYSKLRPRFCSECCKKQDRLDFVRRQRGDKAWSEKQRPANLATPGTSMCDPCRYESASQNDKLSQMNHDCKLS